MKLFLTFLPILILSVPAFADGFSANDKVLYFNSGVLIDVIKNTFPENLQLNVAQKYVDLMDANGNVSVNDLMSVCKTGALNTTKCRDFIQNLLQTDNTNIKPFYWADYISTGFDGDLNIYNSGDGYFHFNDALENGDWAIRFPWMKYKTGSYQKLYPGYNYLRGTSACTNDAGTRYGATDAGYAPNQQSGQHCWCRMTEPEASPWIYYDDKTPGVGGTCERSCALGCMTQLRDETQMRSAMFNAVKLNGSNANTKPDAALQNNLIAALTPPPPEQERKQITQHKKTTIDNMFDWAKTSYSGNKKWYVFKNSLSGLDYYGSYNKQFDNVGVRTWAAGYMDFMQTTNFKRKYPNCNMIRGTTTCNNEKGIKGKSTNKTFKEHEKTGVNCWCKMTHPEKSKWVYSKNDFYGTMTKVSDCDDLCASSCSLVLTEIMQSIGKK